MEKWGGLPHWRFRTLLLGADGHGLWLGAPAGTVNTRPGHQFACPVDAVTLVPHEDAVQRGLLATYYAPGFWCATYVDVTTPARWGAGPEGTVVRTVDLDLDVVSDQHGRVRVDDEDEFAEHQVRLGYPPDLVAAARRSCTAVLAAVQAEQPPYDGPTAGRWLAVVREMAGGDR